MRRAKVGWAVLLVAMMISLNFRFTNSRERSGLDDTLKTTSDELQVQEWASVYDSLHLQSKGLSKKAFLYAWHGFQLMKLENPIVAIADFTQSSCKKRLYVIDMVRKQIVLNTYVAHGRNSGQEFARSFSNKNSSYQSSLGFYRTLGTYYGKHGLSLRLEGVEKGINDNALQRAIVMHGADYVSEQFIKNTGRLGRSLGCPAVSIEDHEQLIRLMEKGAGLFLYSSDEAYIRSSGLLAQAASKPSDLQ